MPSSTTRRKRSSSTASRSSTKRASKAAASAIDTLSADDITNYTTATKWLYNHTDVERLRLVTYDRRTFNLERMRKLLDLLGKPHQQVKCVQVAGTKGKGSTCTMLQSMLSACGYTTGLYTSPHLQDLRERITIDGSLISYADFADLCKRIAEVEDAFADEGGLTFFEIMTAAGLMYFAEQAVDVAVLETGLGGRLDCTTVVKPLVTGISSISLDHMNLLGDTVEDIAREKAGIFKEGVPALSCEQEAKIVRVLKACAEEAGTSLEVVGKNIDFSHRFEANKELGPHSRVSLTTSNNKFEHMPVPLRGEHQAHNCGLALAILDKLSVHGFELPPDRVLQGLTATLLPGRMEQAWPQPRIFLDGAHNAASIQALIKALGAHLQYDSLVMIFGCGEDKDVSGMLNAVSLGADKVIFTRAKSNARAMEPGDLMNRFQELSGKMAQQAKDLDTAVKLAVRAVGREDLIVICGSFYLVGEARKHLEDAAAKRAKK